MKKSRKILISLLVVGMASSGIMGFMACSNSVPNSPDSSNEQEAQVTQNLEYEKIEGKDEYRLVGLGTASDLDISIPKTHKGLPVTEIAEQAFRSEEGKEVYITSVVIPDSVMSIGEAAFYNCSSLKSVVIGDGVTMIGECAFYGCANLTNIEIGNGVIWVGDSAFEACSLTYTTEGDLKYLGNSTNAYVYLAGASSTDIRQATIHKDCKIIGESAFYACTRLMIIEIPDGVVSIGKKAFCGCDWLNSIEFPEGLRSIGYGAFNGCDRLKSLEIPNSVTFIDEAAFSSCFDLSSVVLGNGLTSISNSMFWSCDNLKSVVIPDSVTSIAYGAFMDCSRLMTIEIPDTVISIGDAAFKGCRALKNIVIPNAVTSIGDLIFHNCYNLKTVKIGEGVTSIGQDAFWDCNDLTNIILSNQVTSIGDRAFYGCDSITNIYYEGTANDWTKISIGSYNSDLTNATLYCYSENKPTDESNYWHYKENGGIEIWGVEGSQGLGYKLNNNGKSYAVTGVGACIDTDIEIPSTYKDLPVTTIGSSAFEACNKLTKISIPDSVTKIGDRAFFGCSSLQSMEIGDNVTSIDSFAFHGCSGLTSITVSQNNKTYQSIDGNLYSKDGKTLIQYAIGKTATKFIIPNNVTSIGAYAFYGCSGLKSVEIGDSVTSIGSSAFLGCNGLTSVNIPDSVSSIGSSAFAHCSSLISIITSEENKNYQSIDGNLYTKDGKTLIQYAIGKTATKFTILDSVTKIGDRAFIGCTSLMSVAIPDSVTTIGSYAFYDCSGLTSVVIPDSVTTIGSSVFSNCTNLTSVVIGDGVTMINSSAFSNCTSLTSIVISNRITSIGDRAFYSCDSLKSVYYKGTASDWRKTFMGSYNENLIMMATLYCYSENKPVEEGNYWHYVNGEPAIWE